MKKILIFSNHPAYTYNLRKEIIDGFVDQGYKVTIVVPYGKELEYFKKTGVKLIDIEIKGRSMNPFSDLKLLWENVTIIRKEKPDVILTYATKQNVYGSMAARITETPYIPMITGLGGAIEKKGILQKITSTLYGMGIKRANTLFIQNEAILEKMKSLNMVNSSIRMTPGSGVSLERHPFANYPDEITPLTFLYIGRVMQDKGIYELIEAAKIIKEKQFNVQFKVIGQPNSDEDLNKVNAAHKENLIEFLGPQSDVRPFIRESHATILPSYHEGMANVLLESASAGRPILSTTVPGCKETYDEEITGLGFPSQDVDALVDTIEKFIKLPYSEKKEMGIAGRQKMEKEFDRNIILNMYIEEFEKIGSN